MSVARIVRELNARASEYQIGNLQTLRMKLKGLSKVPTYKLFTSSTTDDKNDAWAFHVGGRKEIQFNVGFDSSENFLRYGVAFSFEASQFLPNPVEVLLPKVQLFNDYLRANESKFKDYELLNYGHDDFKMKGTQINSDWVYDGNFIFFGKSETVNFEEVGEVHYKKILNTFDELLPLYEFVETPTKEIEERIARICWNINHWQRPSGKESKSKNENSHEAREGYGHEEWLLDMSKLIGGYHYGFIQCFNNKKDFSGSKFHLSLFTINGKTQQRYWVGEIRNLEVITPEKSEEIYKVYKKRRWINEMAQQLEAVGVSSKTFLSTPADIFTNVRFRIEDLRLLDKPLEFSNKDEAVTATYYSTLLYKKILPQLEIASDGGFGFNPGHTERASFTKANYGQRTGDIDLAHNRMQTIIYNQLASIYGSDSVGTEQKNSDGTKIDLIVKQNDKWWFYEFKTSNSIKGCIREALSQLLEYCYWFNRSDVERLVICSHNKITDEAQAYLVRLRTEFLLPVYYQRYDPELMKLEEELY